MTMQDSRMQFGRRAQGAYMYLPTVAVVIAAIIVRSMSWVGTDVSCLISLAERVLGGARPYADFVEFNLPAAVLLYVPAVAVGRWVGVAPETVITIAIFGATTASLWFTARILTRSSLLTRQESLTLAPLAFAILLILPEDAFGQREHIATIAILPILAIYSSRVVGQTVYRSHAIVAGLCASLAMSLKPHFALALLLPLFYAALTHRREFKRAGAVLLGPENVVIALLMLAYVVLIFLVFPDYLQKMLPIIVAVYAPARLPWPMLLSSLTILLAPFGLAAAATIGARTALKPLPLVFILAATGFWLTALIQGKGWPYQGYPAIALILLVLCAIVVLRWADVKALAVQRLRPWALSSAMLIAALYFVASAWFWPPAWYPPFVAEVSRLAPPNPRIATIDGGPELAFPIVRILHGTSVGEILLINIAALRLQGTQRLDQAHQRIIERYALAERRAFARSIVEGRPNVLIVARGLEAWALGQPEIAAVLRRFHRASGSDIAEIWLPN
jgi:hypothetical protein